MVTKGALQNVLDVCSSVETSEGTIVDIATVRKQIQATLRGVQQQGFSRSRGGLSRSWVLTQLITKDHEVNMTFLGFLVLFDPPKPEIAETLATSNISAFH